MIKGHTKKHTEKGLLKTCDKNEIRIKQVQLVIIKWGECRPALAYKIRKAHKGLYLFCNVHILLLKSKP